MKIEIINFLKFCLVGLINTIIDFSLLIIFFDIFNWSLNFSIVIAFLIANLNSFYFNKKWTFKNQSINIKSLYLYFLLLSILGVLLNLLIINFLVNNFSIWYIFAKIIAIIFVVFINFTLSRILFIKF